MKDRMKDAIGSRTLRRFLAYINRNYTYILSLIVIFIIGTILVKVFGINFKPTNDNTIKKIVTIEGMENKEGESKEGEDAVFTGGTVPSGNKTERSDTEDTEDNDDNDKSVLTGDMVPTVEDTNKDTTKKEDTTKEDTKENTTKENTTKENTTKENTTNNDTTNNDTINNDTTNNDTTNKDTTSKEDTTKEDNTKEDNTKEDTTKEDTTKKENTKEDTKKEDTIESFKNQDKEKSNKEKSRSINNTEKAASASPKPKTGKMIDEKTKTCQKLAKNTCKSGRHPECVWAVFKNKKDQKTISRCEAGDAEGPTITPKHYQIDHWYYKNKEYNNN